MLCLISFRVQGYLRIHFLISETVWMKSGFKGSSIINDVGMWVRIDAQLEASKTHACLTTQEEYPNM